MEVSETRDLIEKLIKARQARNRDEIYEMLADDAEWIVPAGAPVTDYEGRDAVADAMAGGVSGLFFDNTSMKRDVQQMIVEGGSCAVRQHVTATTKEGTPYDNYYCWVYNCRDGKVVQAIEYLDTLVADGIIGSGAQK